MCSQTQFDLFRILLTRKDATELLVESSPDGVSLPVLPIRRQARPVEEITAAVKKLWNLTTYCLFVVPAENTSTSRSSAVLLETCCASEGIPDDKEWRPVSSLTGKDFGEPHDSAAFELALGRLDQYRSGELQGPFARMDWFQNVINWVEVEAAAVGLRLTGGFRQLNASPTFSLIRFETDGPALWFKTVGEPNLHEYAITGALAKAFPEFLPRLLARRADWSAWLCVEAEGTHLMADSPLRDWERVAGTLARLQLSTFGSALHLIEAGCRDARPLALQALVGPFFEFAAELMDQQTKLDPAPLSRHDLESLALAVAESLDRLVAADTPNVLGHLDFNPGNILVSAERCVFLDWAGGYVGSPFLTLEYLREHWWRLHGNDTAAQKELTAAYTSEWRSFVSPRALAAALECAPLVAVFVFAAAGAQWQSSEPAYLRSLARRMKREADALKQREAICVP
jgi:hypothetical protein